MGFRECRRSEHAGATRRVESGPLGYMAARLETLSEGNRLCPTFAKDGLNVAEHRCPFASVEFHDLTNKDGSCVTRARVRLVRLIGKPKRPGCKGSEVQAIEFGQFEEHDRVGLLDQPPFDLGQVRVRPADSSFDFTERELAVHACAAQDAPDLWRGLSGVGIRLGGRPSDC